MKYVLGNKTDMDFKKLDKDVLIIFDEPLSMEMSSKLLKDKISNFIVIQSENEIKKLAPFLKAATFNKMNYLSFIKDGGLTDKFFEEIVTLIDNGFYEEAFNTLIQNLSILRCMSVNAKGVVEIEKEVEKEVIKEVIKEVEKEVIKEVIKEVPVEVEVSSGPTRHLTVRRVKSYKDKKEIEGVTGPTLEEMKERLIYALSLEDEKYIRQCINNCVTESNSSNLSTSSSSEELITAINVLSKYFKEVCTFVLGRVNSEVDFSNQDYMKREIEELKKKLQQETEELINCDKENQNLSSKILVLEQKLFDMGQKNSSQEQVAVLHDAEMGTVKNELVKAEIELMNATQLNLKLEDEIVKLNSDISNLKTNYSQAVDALAEKNKKYEELEKRLAEKEIVKNNIEKLTKECELLSQTKSKLEDDFSKLENKFNSLLVSKNGLDDTLARERASNKQEKSLLEGKINDLEANYSRAKKISDAFNSSSELQDASKIPGVIITKDTPFKSKNIFYFKEYGSFPIISEFISYTISFCTFLMINRYKVFILLYDSNVSKSQEKYYELTLNTARKVKECTALWTDSFNLNDLKKEGIEDHDIVIIIDRLNLDFDLAQGPNVSQYYLTPTIHSLPHAGVDKDKIITLTNKEGYRLAIHPDKVFDQPSLNIQANLAKSVLLNSIFAEKNINIKV